jgi:membrane protease YdiL (CAAX protease family)
MEKMPDMTDEKDIKQENLLLLVVVIEGILFFIALIWGHMAKINPLRSVHFSYHHLFIAVIAAIIMVIVSYLAVNQLSKFIPFFKNLKDAYGSVAFMAKDITIPQAIIIGITSGFVEEFFFRGILQQQFGIVVASLVFGLLHMGNAKTLAYGIYAVVIGLYLGWLYIITGNLLVPITVHVLNNIIALPYMRYYYYKFVKED